MYTLELNKINKVNRENDLKKHFTLLLSVAIVLCFLDLESILGCMNRQSFQQRMFQELTSENHQQQDLCR